MKTKKLISNLKKEIEEIERIRASRKVWTSELLEKYSKLRKREKIIKAQLQFAEKLIKAIKEDVEELYCGRGIGLRVQQGIIKILNETIK